VAKISPTFIQKTILMILLDSQNVSILKARIKKSSGM